MEFILNYYWEMFIVAEVLSIVSLILFGVFRYFLNKQKISNLFIMLFLSLLILESILGLYVYMQTGEISTFLIILTLFVIYACTFGIVDFIRLDRWMRQKIGNLRGVDLLTAKDYERMARNKNPKHIARKYRISSIIHTIIFIFVQFIFWTMGTESFTELISYLKDFSWVEDGVWQNSPYANEALYSIGMIWGIVFIVDLIYSWSYTIFPNKK